MTLIAACYAAAHALTTRMAVPSAAAVIAVGFLLGWVFQFIGHGFEGKSPGDRCWRRSASPGHRHGRRQIDGSSGPPTHPPRPWWP
ncbi:MAG: DUF962 domain-containing protein [Gemmatimonadaceae bacterium]|nr:DUF962 domain-containing protein [Caulobacter sp.]